MVAYSDSVIEAVFVRFLVKNGNYTAFMRNLAYGETPIRDRGGVNWNVYKKNHPEDEWLLNAFKFSKADFPKKGKDNHDYWCMFHGEWLNHLAHWYHVHAVVEEYSRSFN